jgi:protein-L-isoaspartate(D-aspartate) O-methyltransferase
VSAAHANTGLTSRRVRERMVERVRELGVRDARVLAAMSEVERHRFVDPALASRAYDDCALPIGAGQTISQPYIVARTAELALQAIPDPGGARVLEVGTGSGYAAAVFARLFGLVISIERLRGLHEGARAALRPLRVPNLRLVLGDGSLGLAEHAPYHAILAAAAGEELPPAWGGQLVQGGVVVAPLGGAQQQLTVIAQDSHGQWSRREMEAVRFVPLKAGIGE